MSACVISNGPSSRFTSLHATSSTRDWFWSAHLLLLLSAQTKIPDQDTPCSLSSTEYTSICPSFCVVRLRTTSPVLIMSLPTASYLHRRVRSEVKGRLVRCLCFHRDFNQSAKKPREWRSTAVTVFVTVVLVVYSVLRQTYANDMFRRMFTLRIPASTCPENEQNNQHLCLIKPVIKPRTSALIIPNAVCPSVFVFVGHLPGTW